MQNQRLFFYSSFSACDLMWAATGSQRRQIKRGVTPALLGSLKTRRTAAFWISFRGLVGEENMAAVCFSDDKLFSMGFS